MSDLAAELAGQAEPESGLDPDLDDPQDEVLTRSHKSQQARRGEVKLDQLVEASGFARDMWQDLEQYMNEVKSEPGENDVSSEGESDDDVDDDESDDQDDELVEKTQRVRVDDSQDDSSESSDEETLDESSDAESTAPTTTTTTTTTATTRRHDHGQPKRLVASDIARDRAKTAKQHHTKKSLHSAGKAKGHKWKSSAAIMVGKSGDKSGWS